MLDTEHDGEALAALRKLNNTLAVGAQNTHFIADTLEDTPALVWYIEELEKAQSQITELEANGGKTVTPTKPSAGFTLG